MRALALLLALTLPAAAQDLNFLNHNQPILDAHNCYPYQGKYADRITRALNSGFPVSIEQDLAWYVDPATHQGRVVVSHTPKPTGEEPTLEDYFFKTVTPIVQKIIVENKRDQWPLIVLHFDFKDNQTPALLEAVWKTLGQHEDWLSTAVKTADPNKLSPIDRRPILVVTEEADEQQAVFYDKVPVGAKLRLFGSAHTHPTPKGLTRQQANHWAVTVPPAELIMEKPTNYRRWWNSSWYTVEEGGAPKAADWTPADDARLRALVDYAHNTGFWVRFYALDGFSGPDDKGWGNSYNFGSFDAVVLRWKAVIAAGVNFIPTNQYEELSTFLKQDSKNLRPGPTSMAK